MEELKRFGVSIDEKLLEKFDHYISKKKYQNRSEALRDLIRKELIEESWSDKDAEVAGAIVIVYDHHRNELVENLVVDLRALGLDLGVGCFDRLLELRRDVRAVRVQQVEQALGARVVLCEVQTAQELGR